MLPENIYQLVKERVDARLPAKAADRSRAAELSIKGATVQNDEDLYSLNLNYQDGTYETIVHSVPVKYKTEDGHVNFMDTSIKANGIVSTTHLLYGEMAKLHGAGMAREYEMSGQLEMRLTWSKGQTINAGATVGKW